VAGHQGGLQLLVGVVRLVLLLNYVRHHKEGVMWQGGNQAEVLIVVSSNVAKAKLGLRHRKPAARRVAPEGAVRQPSCVFRREVTSNKYRGCSITVYSIQWTGFYNNWLPDLLTIYYADLLDYNWSIAATKAYF
jgi:hypothetical protein